MVAGRDTIPLMIELANEGYIKINQVEKKQFLGSKTDFVIEKSALHIAVRIIAKDFSLMVCLK